MEIIKITQERMDQILPPTVKDSDLSKNAKRVLATIINYHLVNDKVRISGFLAINNEDLRKSAGIGKEYLRAAVQELIECRPRGWPDGQKWKAGEKSMASEYRLIIENLRKPIRKPTSDDLLNMLFSAPSEPLCTGNSPTNTTTNTISDTITDTGPDTVTYSDTNSETDTDSETTSETGTHSETTWNNFVMNFDSKVSKTGSLATT